MPATIADDGDLRSAFRQGPSLTIPRMVKIHSVIRKLPHSFPIPLSYSAWIVPGSAGSTLAESRMAFAPWACRNSLVLASPPDWLRGEALSNYRPDRRPPRGAPKNRAALSNVSNSPWAISNMPSPARHFPRIALSGASTTLVGPALTPAPIILAAVPSP